MRPSHRGGKQGQGRSRLRRQAESGLRPIKVDTNPDQEDNPSSEWTPLTEAVESMGHLANQIANMAASIRPVNKWTHLYKHDWLSHDTAILDLHHFFTHRCQSPACRPPLYGTRCCQANDVCRVTNGNARRRQRCHRGSPIERLTGEKRSP